MADVVCTGWLKKSPPATKMSIWKFWKDRWCVLKKRGSTYYLEYYKNEWATRPKGEIDLSKCEQVIEGLEFENRRNLLNAHIFNIVTSKRTYYLVTKTEDDMFRWVRNICRVCGFINEEPPQTSEVTGSVGTIQTAPITIPPAANNYSSSPASTISPSSEPRQRTSSKVVSPLPTPDPNDPYIPISECISATSDRAGGFEDSSLSSTENQYQYPSSARTIERQTSTMSTSSMPRNSPPPPPPTISPYDHPPHPVPVIPDSDYDVPPIHSAGLPPINDSEGIYKFVPAPRPKLANDDEDTDPLSRQFDRQLSKLSNMTSKDTLSSSFGPVEADDLVPPPVPVRPGSVVDSETNEIYDIPPNHEIYDVPPSAIHSDNAIRDEDTYDIPPSHRADISQSGILDDNVYDVPPSSIRNESSYDIPLSSIRNENAIDVPQSSIRNESSYDIPPSNQFANNFRERSSSTDELAHKFTEISMKNQSASRSDGSNVLNDFDQHVPPRPPQRVDKVDDEYVYLAEETYIKTSSMGAYDFVPAPRPAQMDITNVPIIPPPRPPKPSQTDNGHSPKIPSTPPPSFDDRVFLNDSTVNHTLHDRELANKLDILKKHDGASTDSSNEEDDYDVPPSNKPANYLDTLIPLQHPGNDYSNISHERPGYVDMTGGCNPHITDTYVPAGNAEVLPMDTTCTYTPMAGIRHPTPPPAAQLPMDRRPQTMIVPPPINRDNKPGRKSMGDVMTKSIPPPLTLIGTGSYYASKDGMFIQSPRTRSFRKAELLPLPDNAKDGDERCDTLESSSSSSDGDGALKDGNYIQLPMPADHQSLELYVTHDPSRTQIYENSRELQRQAPPPPPGAPSRKSKKEPPKKTSEVQYIDLALDEPSDPQPPPRPRVPASPETEYTVLDLEKTQGLQAALAQRTEELNKS